MRNPRVDQAHGGVRKRMRYRTKHSCRRRRSALLRARSHLAFTLLILTTEGYVYKRVHVGGSRAEQVALMRVWAAPAVPWSAGGVRPHEQPSADRDAPADSRPSWTSSPSCLGLTTYTARAAGGVRIK